MKQIQVIGYERVSTEIQQTDRQTADIFNYCKGNNFVIMKSFREKESGTHDVRPELTALLEYVKLNDVKFVIITELSRLGRTIQVLNTIKTLTKFGVGLISMKENVKSLNEDGSVNDASTMFLTMLSSIATYELSTLKNRTNSGKLSAVKAGGHYGGIKFPYGFMIVDAKLVINETEKVIVQQIFEMALTKGVTTIANYLNNKEIPTRLNKRWRDAVIYNMLRNTIYVGERKFKKQIFELPQIIDNELFIKVQNRLSEKGNKQEINAKYEYLLNAKLIQCGVCGRFYFPNTRPLKNGKIESTYKCCTSRYIGETCGNLGVSVEKLELAVTNLIRFRYQINLITELMQPIDATNNLNELKTVLNEIEGFIKKQENSKNGKIELFPDIIKTKSALILALEPIEKEILKLQNQAVNVKAKIKAIEKQIAKINDIDFSDEEETETINKDAVRNIIQSITIYPTDKRFTTRKNEVCIRADISIMNQVTQIFISNRTNDIEIIHVNKKIERISNIKVVDQYKNV